MDNMQAIFWLVLVGGVTIVPLVVLLSVAYWFYSLPMRRMLKAQVIINLVDRAIQDGQPPTMLIGWLSDESDRFLGRKFKLLAYFLANGFSVSDGLRQVPGLVPPKLASILDAGLRVGDVSRVIPLCRRMVHDARSRVESGFHFMFVLFLLMTPSFMITPLVIWSWVLPFIEDVFGDLMEKEVVPGWIIFVVNHGGKFVLIHFVMGALIVLSAAVYVAGPWITRSVFPGFKTVGDWVAMRFAWRRNQCMRDFVEALGLMLDAQVPEREAVELAASCTDNRTFERRAAKVVGALAAGESLIEALDRLDGRGELKWRCENAANARDGFASSLAGWRDALDALAYQQEQRWSQLMTTGFVLYVGLMAAMFLLVIMVPMLHIWGEAGLW